MQCERTNGCIEEGKMDGFFRVTMVKVPDFVEWFPALKNQCKDMCLKNCSCIAYSNNNGIGCMSWSRDLIVRICKKTRTCREKINNLRVKN